MRPRTAGRIGGGLVAAGAAALAYASLVERKLFARRRFDVPVLAPEAERARGIGPARRQRTQPNPSLGLEDEARAGNAHLRRGKDAPPGQSLAHGR